MLLLQKYLWARWINFLDFLKVKKLRFLRQTAQNLKSGQNCPFCAKQRSRLLCTVGNMDHLSPLKSKCCKKKMDIVKDTQKSEKIQKRNFIFFLWNGTKLPNMPKSPFLAEISPKLVKTIVGSSNEQIRNNFLKNKKLGPLHCSCQIFRKREFHNEGSILEKNLLEFFLSVKFPAYRRPEKWKNPKKKFVYFFHEKRKQT